MNQDSEYQKNTRFWDRVAKRYSRSKISDLPSYERKLEQTRTFFSPATKVFEFGCGTGSTALSHAPFVNHIYATDVSANMIEIARRKAQDAGIENVTFEQQAIEDVELPDASVDVVMAMSILHLLKDRRAAFKSAHRVLKPDGVFISSTACLADTQNFLKGILLLGKPFGLVPYCSFFKRDELVTEIEESGFSVQETWQPGRGKAVFITATKR